MTQQMYLGGTFPLLDESMTVNRMGYGAMQLAGPQVWGPPRDVDEAIAVLREAVAAGVNHIGTTMTSLLTSRYEALLMYRSSRWEASVRYSRQCWTQQQHRFRLDLCRSRLGGFFSDRRTSC